MTQLFFFEEFWTNNHIFNQIVGILGSQWLGGPGKSNGFMGSWRTYAFRRSVIGHPKCSGIWEYDSLMPPRDSIIYFWVLKNGKWVTVIEQRYLLDPDVRIKLLDLIKLGGIRSVGIAPICASFSMAITPPVRSKQFPKRKAWEGYRRIWGRRFREGNSHGNFCVELVQLCREPSITFFLENPDTLWMWKQRGYQDSSLRHEDLWRSGACMHLKNSFTFLCVGSRTKAKHAVHTYHTCVSTSLAPSHLRIKIIKLQV